MIESDKKAHVFYHDPCLDGSAAAWAAYQCFGEYASYIGAGHQSYDDVKAYMLKLDPKADILYFVDYVPAKEVLQNFLDQGFQVNIYDHHISAIDMLNTIDHRNLSYELDANRSGVGLVWDSLCAGNKRPNIVNIIEAIDLNRGERFETDDVYFGISAFCDAIDLNSFTDFREKLDEVKDYTDQQLCALGAEQRLIYLNKIKSALREIDYAELPPFPMSRIAVIYTDLYEHSRELVPKLMQETGANIVMMCFVNGSEYRINIHSKGAVSARKISLYLKEQLNCRGGGHEHSVVLRMDEGAFDKFCQFVGKSY